LGGSAPLRAGGEEGCNRLQVQGRFVAAEGPAAVDFIAGKHPPITTSGSGTQLRRMPLSNAVFAF